MALELERPVRLDRAALRGLIDEAGDGRLDTVELLDADGRHLVRVCCARARAPRLRWGRSDLFPSRIEAVDGLCPVNAEPDLEAYLGGWEGEEGRKSAETPGFGDRERRTRSENPFAPNSGVP